MKDMRLLFAGFGGQGILFMGKVAAYAGLIDGYHVTWMPSYGPEMRGGTANCSVRICEEVIGSPLVTSPEVLVAMNGPSYEKFLGSVQAGGSVFVEDSLVCVQQPLSVLTYAVAATRLAQENDLPGLANMILLGKVLKITQFSSYETIKQAIQKSVSAEKERLVEYNLRAVRLGMEQC